MKAKIVGVQRISGTSEKNGTPQPYDMSRLLVLEPIETVNRGTFNREGYGFSVMEVPCEPGLLATLREKNFPFDAELITAVKSAFGRLETVVTAVK